MRKLLATLLCLTSITTYASATYYSDGSFAETYNNGSNDSTTYFSGGGFAETQGNTTYFSDGSFATTD